MRTKLQIQVRMKIHSPTLATRMTLLTVINSLIRKKDASDEVVLNDKSAEVVPVTEVVDFLRVEVDLDA
jgi:hypothetical protein